MTDSVGLFQHATMSAPNPAFGYCTDDNARALLFVTQAFTVTPDPILQELSHLSAQKVAEFERRGLGKLSYRTVMRARVRLGVED